jgi:hypothetical protein
VILIRRLTALATVLVLSIGNVAPCAGWQLTPEARMACCRSAASCPMHKPEGHDHSSRTGVSQTQADSCCAASAERRESSSAVSTFASSGVIALVPAAVFSVAATVPVPQGRALVPRPVSSVATHIFLSVLLI